MLPTDFAESSEFKVYITFHESYSSFQTTKPILAKPIGEDLRKILTGLNFAVAKKKADSDILLELKIYGKPIAADYQKMGTLYTGAEIYGDIVIEVSGTQKWGKFSGKCVPPSPIFVLGDDYKTPEKAPFNKAYQYSNLLLSMAKEFEAQFQIPTEKFLTVTLQKVIYKKEVAEELAKIGMPAVPYLAGLLNNPHEKFDVRDNAAMALGKTGLNDAQVLESLNKALDDKAKMIRMSAAMALAEISRKRGGLEKAHTSKAVFVLTPYLTNSKEAFYRQESIKALGDLGNELAVEPLINSFKHVQKNAYLKQQVSEALKKLTGQNFGSDSKKWLEWWQQNGGG